MHALLTTMLALTGAGLATWGFARTLRHRFSVRDRLRSLRGRRSGVILYAVGFVLLLVPDVLAGAVVASGPADNEATAVLGALGAVIWRAAVVLGCGLGALVLFLTSERVTRPVQAGAVALAGRVPRRVDFEHARLRRREGLGEFPRQWGELVEHDRALARRLLGQGNGLETDFGAHRSALKDWDDPVTRRAMEALVECDRLRTPVPPRGTRDVLGSDYGRAVAAFDAAVVAAEINAETKAETRAGTRAEQRASA